MKTKDCYFQIDKQLEEENINIIINPKEYWETEECLDDSGEEPEDLDSQIYSVMEGVYESELSPKEVYNKMINLGAEYLIMFKDEPNGNGETKTFTIEELK